MSVKNSKLLGYFDSFKNYISIRSKRRSFRYGIPFVILVVGGSFCLREWTQIRYQFSKVKGVGREEAKKMGLNRTKEVTLEETYEEIQKLDIDNWENKRGPRPWEEPVQETKATKKQ